jgi:hypothetical protein
MNKIQSIIAALSEEDLREAVLHLKATDDSEVVPEGALRRVVQTMVDEANLTDSDAFGIARIALLQAAAYRWVGIAP